MKQRKAWRYTCEHCKKSGCNKTAILKHEQGCCKNPNRICGICREVGLTQQPLTLLIAEQHKVFGAGDDIELGLLRENTDGCPACMLATIIQGKLNIEGDEEGPGKWFPFVWKTEHDEFWKRHNEANIPSQILY
jgi:hypothetical protein